MCKPNEADSEAFQPHFITGKDLERHFELNDALLEYARLFQQDEQNDRALVIVGATFLDLLLEHILAAFLVDDQKEVKRLLKCDQPLGTFGGRITVAYCLGLISAVIRDDLRVVAEIRNKFAHDLYAAFDQPRIQSNCDRLKWHRDNYMEPPEGVSARDLFYVGVHQLVAHLGGVVSIARGERRTPCIHG